MAYKTPGVYIVEFKPTAINNNKNKLLYKFIRFIKNYNFNIFRRYI